MAGKETPFDRWAAAQLGVSPSELSLARITELPERTDLPAGPDSDLGGEVTPLLDDPTETELRELARLGEEILAEFPERPPGYRPPTDNAAPLAVRSGKPDSAGTDDAE